VKPSKPLRSTALERSTPLRGGKPPTRRTRLRAQSDKRRKENRERREMANRLWPDGRPRCVVPWCTRLADDLHEPLTRARGGSITSPENAEPLCRTDHDALEDEPQWAYDLELLVHSWDKRTAAQIAAARRDALASARADLEREAS
jgi:hypothetical protein